MFYAQSIVTVTSGHTGSKDNASNGKHMSTLYLIKSTGSKGSSSNHNVTFTVMILDSDI